MGTLTLTVDDRDALLALFDDHLSKRRAFVPGVTSALEREACDLVVQHEGCEHVLRAEVVYVKTDEPGRGVGLQLVGLDAEAMAALSACFQGLIPLAPDEPPRAEETPEEHAAPDGAAGADAAADEAANATSEASPQGDAPLLDDPVEEDDDSDQAPGTQTARDRIRAMSGAEQLRLAAAGTLTERTILERMLGPGVWETLLRNARVTIPEVARIARKGSLPRPLVELIAANPPWLASAEVQRALLSNPRSSPAVIQKVFRAMSRHDLLLVPQQTAYPEAVRTAAKRRLGR